MRQRIGANSDGSDSKHGVSSVATKEREKRGEGGKGVPGTAVTAVTAHHEHSLIKTSLIRAAQTFELQLFEVKLAWEDECMSSSRVLRTKGWKRLRDEWRLRIDSQGGVICWRCAQLIRPGQRFHLGHVVDRALGGDESQLAPEHVLCSTSAGGELSVMLRRADQDLIISPPTGQLFIDPPPR